MTESTVALPLYAESAMCFQCYEIQRQLHCAQDAATGLTDPASVVLTSADIKDLEAQLAEARAVHDN